jgi:hypothetical protein
MLLLDQGRYRSWDCRTGQERLLTPEGLTAVGFSATAKLAALCGRLADDPAKTLHIWDLAGGKRVAEIPGLSELPSRVDFSPNGRYAICQFPADENKSMRVWDMRLRTFTNRLISPRGLILRTRWPDGSDIVYRSFNPDGSLVASVVMSPHLDRQFLCIWDTATGDVLANLPGVVHWWSSDGKKLIVHVQGSVASWKVTRPPPSYELGDAVKSLSLNKDGSRLAVNNFVCAVVRGEQGSELIAWDGTPQELFGLRGLFPQFVGKDETWVVRLKRNKEIQTTYGSDQPIYTSSIVGLMGSPQGTGPLLAYSALCPRPFELFPTTTYQTELMQLSPHQRQIVLPNDYPEHPNWAHFAPALGQRLEIYDSVETHQWAFAPEAPLLLRRGVKMFRPAHQPWKKRDYGSGGGMVVDELWNYQEGKRLAVLGFCIGSA